MNGKKEIFKYVGFFACYTLLLFFVLVTSTHEYEYMLKEAGSEFTSWCRLPTEKDPTRREMYMVFLILFCVMGILFLRRNNFVFIACMSFIFCYATYVFIFRDMACSIF